MTKLITQEDINAQFPIGVRYFLPVSSVNIPSEMSDSVNALVECVNIISSKIKIDQKVHIIIGTSPFRVSLSSGELSFTSKEQTIHVNIEKFIFLDFNKINLHHHHLKVACILEEFVHALMNVKDEILVSHVVQFLYSHISLNEQGQYTIS